jgi:phytoene/squalene synthetase
VRDLSNPANARDLVRSAARHPAARELASAGLMFLPIRYLPVGWAATWVTHRVLRRHIGRPAEVLDAPAFGASRPLKNVTPEAPKV